MYFGLRVISYVRLGGEITAMGIRKVRIPNFRKADY
jgi:hypothetical protein